MKSVLESRFSKIFSIINERSTSLKYYPKMREFGIASIEPDGTLSRSFDSIYYCPFTGEKLPDSLRDEFFDLLEGMGLEPFHGAHPPEFETEEWWVKRGL